MHKFILKILKLLLKAILYVLLLIVTFYFALYVSCPIYNFPNPKPFAGNKIYNPYHNMDSALWRKANFHAHTRNYGGITDGRKNTSKTVIGIYKYLGYDNYSISDYQKINLTNFDFNYYIPCYEHGYGIWKNHQLCIGASKVSWLDYPIFQTVHQQQNVINYLRDDVEAIAIAHPFLRNSYKPSQFAKLTNYDLVEAVSNYCISEPHWDSALSVGRRVYVLASDDVHNTDNTNEVGRKFNMINASTSDRENIITSLKNGKSYAVDFHLVDKEDYYTKMKRVQKLPYLTKIDVVNDSLIIKVSDSTAKFVFIGQGGKILDSVVNSNIGVYKIKTEDNYVRTRVYLPDGSTFYLNPVTRYDGDVPPANALATINYPLTWLLRIIGFSILFFILNKFIFKRINKFKRQFNQSIKHFYKIENKFIRYIFVGGLNTLFSFTVYAILVFIGLQYYYAVFIASSLGVLFNYKTTGVLVFEHKSNKQILKFIILYLITYGLSVGGIKILLTIHVDKYSAAIITAIPIALITYYLNKKFVFTKKEEIAEFIEYF